MRGKRDCFLFVCVTNRVNKKKHRIGFKLFAQISLFIYGYLISNKLNTFITSLHSEKGE